MPLKDSIRRVVNRVVALPARPVGFLIAQWHRTAPRERRLVGALAGVIGALLMILGGYLYFDSLSSLAERNADMREALAEIAKNRTRYLEAKAKVRAQEMQLGLNPPQLLADLDAAAKEVGVQLGETNERPNTPIGKRYVQHEVDVKLRGVDLVSLSKFLVKIESGRNFIIITRLDLRRRFSEADKLDVDLTAAAFERAKEKPKAPARPAG